MTLKKTAAKGSTATIRGVLAGFAGLLLLMAALGIDATLQTQSVSSASSRLRTDSRTRDSALDLLSNDLYRSATLVRDYLVERDDTIAARQKAELEDLRARSEQSLARFAVIAPASEKPAIQNLLQLSGRYWDSFAPALAWSPAERHSRGGVLLRDTIVPDRDLLIRFVRQVGALDERILDSSEEDLREMQTRFQSRVLVISAVMLLFGIALAALVTLHLRRLGREANRRYDEALAAREDLRRLSDRLVAVQEEERRSLSRELHDDLGQVMSAILIELGKLDAGLHDSPARRETLASVRRLAEETVAKVRDMALLLRPAMLDELGLVPALRWQIREVNRRAGLKVKLVADEIADDLPDAHRTCVFRVVQEALHNCVRHAQASDVRVVLRREQDGLSVAVQDNGVGFTPAAVKGLGLLGMTERVTTLGGRLHVDSGPGRGTVLSTWFPLDRNRCRVQETVS